MVKWIADITFEGKKEKKRFSQGEEFEMTVERAAEVEKNIKAKHDVASVMSRVEEKEVEEEQPVDTKEPAKKEEAKKSKEDSK